MSKYGHSKYSGIAVPESASGQAKWTDWYQTGWAAMGEKWNRAGFNFVPLITSGIPLRCGLDILLLRPEAQEFIFKQGDIDGQVKTLFDALRIPQNGEETGDGPQDGEDPFFCLLEDDRLISEVHVVADQLLLLPGERQAKATDAFITISVNLTHNPPATFDQYYA